MSDFAQKDPRVESIESAIACQTEAIDKLDAILDDLLSMTEPSAPTPRRAILIAGTKRTQQTAEIIVDLAQKRYVEDMAILNRTIAETAINTCYLQVCDEDEYKRFMIFDPIADLRLHRELKDVSGYVALPEAEAILEKMAQDALGSGLFRKNRKSWTEVPLGERARLSDEAIDNRFNEKCLQLLRMSVYQHGHTFVHFTRRGLGYFASAYLQLGQPSESQRLMQVLVMVGAANQAMMGIAMFLMSKFKLAKHEEWDRVNEILLTIERGMNYTDLSPL
jgi:hypothetical protein